ncbi:HDOD domain-containing protein [Thermosipho ferrireducens]|uniref:HDOD domain-containing protein n=1 Tax=Thermosipho ferrireducens TaxID=2571116 RepID=A0ABX7S6K9_9BACT|nr:HDOD domain-containing protein [Thermosipho ferrireducens]
MLKEFILEIEEIPTPDFQVQQIINIASNPEASVKDIERAISLDAALSAKVLRLVNSAYYGLPRKITKLSEAVMILGFKTVRNLALSIFTYSTLQKGNSNVNKENLWKHFMATAIISETIAKHIGYPEREEAFMAGLLHDIGKVALDITFPEVLSLLEKASRETNRPFHVIERDLEFESHTLLGQTLLEKWTLPDLFQVVSQFHETPSENENKTYNEILYIVHLANFISNLMYEGYSLSHGQPILESETFNVFGIKPSKLIRIVEESERNLLKAGDLLEGGKENET